MTPPPNIPADHLPTDDELRAWIRAFPETWDDPGTPVGSDVSEVDDLDRLDAADEALLRRVLDGEVHTRLGRERRRARMATAVVAGLVSAGAAVGVAALVRSGQPTRPELGVVCRSAASLDADAVVVGEIGDPLAACADAWMAGALGTPPEGVDLDPSGVPALTACIGSGGAIEVFPGDGSTCGSLGLEPAAPLVDEQALAIAVLQDRIAAEVNLACVPGSEIEARLERLLADGSLSGWSIQLTADARGARCVLVAVDGLARSLKVTAAP